MWDIRKQSKEEKQMQVINSSQVDAWQKAAEAKGGIQSVKVRPERVNRYFDPWEVIKKRQDGYGVDVRARMTEALRNGEAIEIPMDDSHITVQNDSVSSNVDRYEGKTIVENENKNTGMTVYYVDPKAFEGSSFWASKAENRGAAIHTFFYQETNFLEEAAKEYAVLEDDEMFRYRDIDDGSFIQETLRFFTGKHGTDKDREEMKHSMENVVMELSRMIRNGEEADINKVQSKLTVAGVEVSMAELMEYQQMGRKIASSFLGASMGTLDSGKIAGAAEVGIAKAMGNLYGSERGELGKMFSDGIDRLYEKAIANREKSAQASLQNWHSTPSLNEALDLEVDLSKLFAGMDTSSREGIVVSFQNTLSRAKSSVLSYCYKYGGSYIYNPFGGMIDLNKAANQTQSFFQSWLDRIAQTA